MAIRNRMGAWCGYVAVDEAHPYFAEDVMDLDFEHDLNVHGGVTYNDFCAGHICHVPEPGRPDRVWWIGFDCGHYNDYVPSVEANIQRLYDEGKLPFRSTDEHMPAYLRKTYKPVAYVRNEVEDLARQLAAIGS